MRHYVGNKQAEGNSWEFYKIIDVCFNAVCAVFHEVFGYIQTDIQTVLFCNTEDRHCYSCCITRQDIPLVIVSTVNNT